jgi:hypothetical protein
MSSTLERDVRVLKVAFAALAVVFLFSVFRSSQSTTQLEEVKTRRVVIVDSADKTRLMLASDYKKDNSAGVYFFNQEGTESGALNYNGKRGENGRVEAYAIWTMDQFKDDEIVRVGYDQTGDQKRQGLTISERPDSLTERARQVIHDLGNALQSAKSPEEARALRREYLARVPARELGARRLFAGRDADGTSGITLSDPDGKPRLRLQVDKDGNASIAFLDEAGRVTRTIAP